MTTDTHRPSSRFATIRANRAGAPVRTTGMERLTTNQPTDRRALLLAAVAGAAVSVALGTYGRVHEPSGGSIVDLGFPSLGAMKAWLATVAFTLAVVQLASALAMFGRFPGVHRSPSWLPVVHRWSGTAAFVVSLPVAYHCLWALGFQDTGARQLVHSVLGCAFYGAFATKLLCLRLERAPRWVLPVAGSLLVSLLTGAWITSSLWFFTNVDFPALR